MGAHRVIAAPAVVLALGAGCSDAAPTSVYGAPQVRIGESSASLCTQGEINAALLCATVSVNRD
ncbi:MAG: hypothetical protein H6522_07855 [Mycolicibacterium sp.]|nr:hypothetical protein [Mycobacterium sp.]MCB9417073.1 hypothetical protein [Mycolicibacterium sp.]